MKAGARWLAICLLAAATPWAHAQDGGAGGGGPALEATLERNPVRMGETVRLRVTLDGAETDTAPDLAPLERDFEVLGTSRRTQRQWVNGRQSASTQWRIELAPKAPGRIELPGLVLKMNDGSVRTSNALELRVLAAATAAGDGGPVRPIFLESAVEPSAPYVNAQIVYSIKLYYAMEVLDGSISEPRARGATVHRLGSDTTYSATRAGQSYRVFERRYAVFAQTPGELVIEPVAFTGEISDTRPGAGRVNPLFARGRPVRVTTETVSVGVKPRPDAAAGVAWTPAQALGARESWSSEPLTIRAGEPVTRTITLEAVGLQGEQIPAIEFGEVEGLKLYPDRATVETDTSRTDALHGSRVERVALVPSRAGPVTLPEIRIRWWDTTTDAPRETVIASRTLEVLPASAVPVSGPGLADGAAALAAADAPYAWLAGPVPWQIGSGVLGLLWVVTLVAWRRARAGGSDGGREDPESPGLTDARRELRFACVANDAPRARRALVAWGRAAWPHDPPRTLPALAQRLRDAALRDALNELDRTLYAPAANGAQAWTGTSTWQAASRALVAPGRRRASQAKVLPALYPPAA